MLMVKGTGKMVLDLVLLAAGALPHGASPWTQRGGQGKTTIKLLMVQDLGWIFDARVGLHIDVFPSAFVSEHDPVRS